jgi:DNA-binding LytR/AlgR family response regulator
MVHVAIVEDSAFDQKILVDCLKEYESETGTKMQITVYSSGEKLVEHYPKQLDILFMDIMMGEMDGLRTARLVRRQDEKVILIFVTSMIQYAIQGYGVDAMDFVVKPVSYTGIKIRMDRALYKLQQAAPIHLEIVNADGIYQVNANDICYLETFNHKVIVHTKDQVIPANASLRSFEKALEKLPFFRCHTSFLVNLQYVDKIQGNNIWINGQLLSISRYRRKEFLEAWSTYLGK